MERDFLKFNGQGLQGSGSVAARLIECNCDVNALRPWRGGDGKTYITINEKGKNYAVPVNNADSVLTKQEWVDLDNVIMRVARAPLRIVRDVRAEGLTYSVPNGMGAMVLQTQRMTDAGDAVVSMDALKEGQNDRPVFDLINLPLPIIHADFSFSAREIAVSRNGGAPLDTTMAEQATHKVMVEAEKFMCGTRDTYTYGGGTVYGLRNYPNGIGMTLTAPDSSDWTPKITVDEVLEMRQRSQDAHYFGPFMLYFDHAWDKYLDMDYDKHYPNVTLRSRLKQLDSITNVVTLQYMNKFDCILVQMTSNVIRLVVGMELVVVQWQEKGGMLVNFKVMCIYVPQIRCDKNNNTGLVQATVPGETADFSAPGVNGW
jgi:uncharacterized linocin/CFP29 family protein